jgi:hypothetical protein
MTTARPRRRKSAVDGGPPLGLGDPSATVDGLTYYAIKRRLGLVTPAEPGSVTERQREYVGVVEPDPQVIRPDGWRSLTGTAFDRLAGGRVLDEYDRFDPFAPRMVISEETLADLNALMSEGPA